MKEIWKDVEGYEGLYQVSNLGNVKSLKRKKWNGFNFIETTEKILKTSKSYKGYLRTRLYKDGKSKCFPTHRIVAQAFIPNPNNKPQVNHIDGDKTNNKAENLEWCTNAENQQHAIKTKLRKTKLGDVRPKKEKLRKDELLKKQKCILDKYRKLAIEKAKNKNSIKIVQTDKFNNFLNEFTSIKEAQEKTGITHIYEILKGERKNNSKYNFYYK